MAHGQVPTNFTGIWELNLKRSALRTPMPQRLVVTIEHCEAKLRQESVITRVDGSEQRMVFHYVADTETTNSLGPATIQTRSWWSGAELVIESRMKMPDREAYFKDHWSLSSDGQTLTMAHRDDDLDGQIAILEKISADITGPHDTQT